MFAVKVCYCVSGVSMALKMPSLTLKKECGAILESMKVYVLYSLFGSVSLALSLLKHYSIFSSRSDFFQCTCHSFLILCGYVNIHKMSFQLLCCW